MSVRRKRAVDAEPARRLMTLFQGNTRSSGRFNPETEKMWAEYAGATLEDFVNHVDGKMGLGVVPIQDDDTCVWAAIDIDDHDSDEDIPIHPVSERIATLKLPLVTCRSKSGGIHCYLFLEKPHSAARIRTFMAGWASAIGYGGAEIFPKQGRLTVGKDNKKAYGNWINLPYFGGEDTMRYAVHDGKKLGFLKFLDLAEKMRASEADLRSLSKSEHPDAPPCVQKMYSQGVAQGHRNEALYNIVVYLKKAHPGDYTDKAQATNGSIFNKPLPRGEMQRTITSASRPDCGYRCNEEPIRSLCDREVCLTRKYGITAGDFERLNTVDALPIFGGLVKYLTNPIRWEIAIDGVKVVNISTPDLLDWRKMRELIADRLTRIVPMIKGQEWERILHPLMLEARVVETPDDASIEGVIRDRAREFASKVDLTNPGQDKSERKALLRGLPVVQVVDGERCVVFRGQDFINYLKRTRSEELKGVNLWFAMQGAGVFHSRMRIPETKNNDNINVWCLPVRMVQVGGEQDAKPQEFKSDL